MELNLQTVGRSELFVRIDGEQTCTAIHLDKLRKNLGISFISPYLGRLVENRVVIAAGRKQPAAKSGYYKVFIVYCHALCQIIFWQSSA